MGGTARIGDLRPVEREALSVRAGRGRRETSSAPELLRPSRVALKIGRMSKLSIIPMTADHWPDVRRIYAEGIATGDATLEREAPDWAHFDRSHPTECRLVARDASGATLGWTALGGYSSRKVYAGVAWESVYVAADARGRGVGRTLLEALIPASEAAGYWTLFAGVMAENAEPRAPRAARLPAGRRPGADGPGRSRPLARRRLARATEPDRRARLSALRPRLNVWQTDHRHW